jgi:phosphohistidine swiveling domain-containing protein
MDMTWKIYTRGTIFPHSFSLSFKAHQLSEKLIGFNFLAFFYINIEDKLWWAWKEDDVLFLGASILKRCETKRGQERDFKKFDEFCKRALKAADKVRRMDLGKFSDRELLGLYDYIYKESANAHGLMNPYIDVIDVVFEDFLMEKIKTELKAATEAEALNVYKELTVPSCLTYLIREEEDIIRGIISGKSVGEIAKTIFKKYWWISLGWENMHPHSEQYFAKKITKHFKLKNLAERLGKIKSYGREIKNKRKIIIKQYGLSKNIAYWLDVLDELAYYHDVRKEMQMRTVYASHQVLEEISKRIGIPVKNLLWFWEDEVKEFLLNKSFDREELENRKKAFFSVVYKGSTSWLSGEKALSESKKYIGLENGKQDLVREFRGFAASKGMVRSKVKVCAGYVEALKKVKKGEILVCGMTTPDYVPAMRKASAIITDEGGITCHAAIISRELGIPCVVGTKVATQVLHDGDLVEVDANVGIIRILNN